MADPAARTPYPGAAFDPGSQVSSYNQDAFVRENISGRGANGSLANLTAPSSGVMLCVSIKLFAGDPINNITFVSGTTPASAPTHWWFALYDDTITAPALLGQTADKTNTAWAAQTAKTVALTSQVIIPRTGLYWAACMVTASTVPTLLGADLIYAVMSDVVITGQRKLAVTSGSSLTDTAPATIVTAGTAASTRPYVALT